MNRDKETKSRHWNSRSYRENQKKFCTMNTPGSHDFFNRRVTKIQKQISVFDVNQQHALCCFLIRNLRIFLFHLLVFIVGFYQRMQASTSIQKSFCFANTDESLTASSITNIFLNYWTVTDVTGYWKELLLITQQRFDMRQQ